MAVVYEQYSPGLVRAYSDTGHRLVQNGTGIVYDEAIDPVEMNRTYEEYESMREFSAEEILAILTGGEL